MKHVMYITGVDAPNQKLEDLWSIPLPLERGEFRVRE